MTSRLPQALRTRTSFALIRLATLVRHDCADAVATLGINQQQHAILSCLEEFGPDVQKAVAARLGFDSGDIVAFLDGLQSSGLITRERDSADRRRQILTITDSGSELLGRVDKLLGDEAKGALGALTPEERAQLYRLCVTALARHSPESWTG